jgi:hypothetical protein
MPRHATAFDAPDGSVWKPFEEEVLLGVVGRVLKPV